MSFTRFGCLLAGIAATVNNGEMGLEFHRFSACGLTFAGTRGPTPCRWNSSPRMSEEKTLQGIGLGCWDVGMGKDEDGDESVSGRPCSGSMGDVLATLMPRSLDQQSSGRSALARCPSKVSLDPAVPMPVSSQAPGPGPDGGSLPSQ